MTSTHLDGVVLPGGAGVVLPGGAGVVLPGAGELTDGVVPDGDGVVSAE